MSMDYGWHRCASVVDFRGGGSSCHADQSEPAAEMEDVCPFSFVLGRIRMQPPAGIKALNLFGLSKWPVECRCDICFSEDIHQVALGFPGVVSGKLTFYAFLRTCCAHAHVEMLYFYDQYNHASTLYWPRHCPPLSKQATSRVLERPAAKLDVGGISRIGALDNVIIPSDALLGDTSLVCTLETIGRRLSSFTSARWINDELDTPALDVTPAALVRGLCRRCQKKRFVNVAWIVHDDRTMGTRVRNMKWSGFFLISNRGAWCNVFSRYLSLFLTLVVVFLIFKMSQLLSGYVVIMHPF